MMRNSGQVQDTTKVNSDLLFACEHCGIPLVVDCAAAGINLTCEGCGKPITVPERSSASSKSSEPERSEKLAELRRHLKENESQRTEVKGYINQLSIQLHRWQLRLQGLDERNIQLNGQISALAPEL